MCLLPLPRLFALLLGRGRVRLLGRLLALDRGERVRGLARAATVSGLVRAWKRPPFSR